MFMLIVKAGVLAFATATGAACAVATLGIRADLLDKTQKIHKAAIRGDVVEVGDCLARNIPPDVRSGMQRTGLIYAAYLGRTAVSGERAGGLGCCRPLPPALAPPVLAW